MNIILTNDDGYQAPGLAAAYEALRALGTVHVVAPREERSACSHAITLRRPITVRREAHPSMGPIFTVEGSPADCVRLAAVALIDKPIDLVVAGINAGANAGVDTWYSGTVAGAREAAVLGLKAVAVSQARRAERETDWARAGEATGIVLRHLFDQTLPGPGFWNVNLPAPIPSEVEKSIEHVPVSTQPVPMQFDRREGDDGQSMQFAYGASYWLRDVSGPSDYSVLRDGRIAVSAVPLFGRF